MKAGCRWYNPVFCLREINIVAQLYNRLAIFGVGLIGGSVALALKQFGQVGTVVGIGRHHDTLQDALRLGVIDEAADSPEAVRGADIVLLATPVGQFSTIMQAIVPYLEPNAVITDTGSTKQDVAIAARAHLGQRVTSFVPAHPIAGAEKSGVGAARGDLFHHRNVILTPVTETRHDAIETAYAFWQACGAHVSQMTAREHDEVFAAVSHLPHLLAFGLVAELAERSNAETLFDYAAGGFRDFTRIAGSSPEMWRDISLANRDALLKELEAFQNRIVTMTALLRTSDGAGLQALFEVASKARNDWADKQ